MSADPAAVRAAASPALKRGNKLEAIKRTREATGLGLKESKQAVEALLREDDALATAYETARPTGSSLPLVAFVIAVTLLIYWFFLRG